MIRAALISAAIGLGGMATAQDTACDEQWRELRQLTVQARGAVRDLQADDPVLIDARNEIIAAHERFIRQCPEHGPAWASLGRLAVDAGDMGKADQAFGAAVQVDPDNIGARVAWATAWLNRDPDRGIALLDRFIAAHPDNLILHLNLVTALSQVDPEGIDRRFDAWIAQPDTRAAATALAQTMLRSAVPRAQGMIARLYAVAPTDDGVLATKARSHRAANEFAQARAAMELIPPHQRATPERRYLYSDTCYANHDFAEALAQLEAIDMEALATTDPSLHRRLRFLLPLRRRLAETWPHELARRAADAESRVNPIIELTISGQRVVCELFADAAPNTVSVFLTRAARGDFDDTPLVQVDKGFRTMFGLPPDTPGLHTWTLPGEFERPQQRPHGSGALSIIRDPAHPDSARSMFTVSHFPTPHLDGARTNFGRVIEGLEIIRMNTPDQVLERVHVRRPGATLPPPMVLTQDGDSIPLPAY
ncbi:MAG: peptidylprolyl isomerase [Phycisphaerales bacterium]|nr:peptidylprolyl isomerase [Phycisphaerales bacterium]